MKISSSVFPAVALGQSLSADELKTEVATLQTNYEVANNWLQNDANWGGDNKLYELHEYLRRDFWRFAEWTITFEGSKIAEWMPILNQNTAEAISKKASIATLWDDYVATPSNGELPFSSEIDDRFFETKGKHKHGKNGEGGEGGKWKDDIDWTKCKTMDKQSESFATECGAKKESFKNFDKRGDCDCGKGGKDIWEKADKTKDEWDKMSEEEKAALKEKHGKKDNDGFGKGGKDDWDKANKTKAEWEKMTEEEKTAAKANFKKDPNQFGKPQGGGKGDGKGAGKGAGKDGGKGAGNSQQQSAQGPPAQKQPVQSQPAPSKPASQPAPSKPASQPAPSKPASQPAPSKPVETKPEPKQGGCRCGKPQKPENSSDKPAEEKAPQDGTTSQQTRFRRDGHEAGEHQMLKESGKGGKTYTVDEFKNHLKEKISKKLGNIQNCNKQIDDVPADYWSKFEQVAADEKELKITLHLMHFCMKDGRGMKDTIKEIADEAGKGEAVQSVEEVMNNQVVQLESKSLGCTDEDLFCNIEEEVRQSSANNMFTAIVLSTLMLSCSI